MKKSKRINVSLTPPQFSLIQAAMQPLGESLSVTARICMIKGAEAYLGKAFIRRHFAAATRGAAHQAYLDKRETENTPETDDIPDYEKPGYGEMLQGLMDREDANRRDKFIP